MLDLRGFGEDLSMRLALTFRPDLTATDDDDSGRIWVSNQVEGLIGEGFVMSASEISLRSGLHTELWHLVACIVYSQRGL
jgi:hypothetical protein